METYDVHLLLVQWPESYPGESSPEVVDAVDEYVLDSNPQAWDEMVERARDRFSVIDEVPRLGRLVVTVDRTAIDQAVNPAPPRTAALTTRPEGT